jgi:hypothetical protein
MLEGVGGAMTGRRHPHVHHFADKKKEQVVAQIWVLKEPFLSKT